MKRTGAVATAMEDSAREHSAREHSDRPAYRAVVRRRQRGTASIEFVGLFPVILIGMLLLLQLFAAVYTAHAASMAARQGAREYSLTDSAAAGRQAAAASLPGAVTLVDAAPTGQHHGFRVVVRAPAVLKVGDRNFSSEVAMP